MDSIERCTECEKLLDLYDRYTDHRVFPYDIQNACVMHSRKLHLLYDMYQITHHHLHYCPVRQRSTQILEHVPSLKICILLRILHDDLYFAVRNQEYVYKNMFKQFESTNSG
uniref:Uncharacterized protein n=1 Tax=viral metagenome TaxID=1070528 RepID=A0A6C0CRG9_9ZZZZ